MSQDMNKRILVELCGWKPCDHISGDYAGYPPGDDPGTTLPTVWVKLTESLDACMQWIVPAMQARGFEWELAGPVQNAPEDAPFNRISATFTGNGMEWMGLSDKPALAVCNAVITYLGAQGAD